MFNVFALCFADVDECAMGTSDCHDNATCSNTIGTYECTCIFGYTGDGFNCICKFFKMSIRYTMVHKCCKYR